MTQWILLFVMGAIGGALGNILLHWLRTRR